MSLAENHAPERLASFLMELRARGIRDTVLLSACERAPRERFLKPLAQPYAYRDVELPIGCGQSSESPYETTRRLALLTVRQRDVVLEIGAGSGYQTALLGFCARRVIAVERYRSLALDASRRLHELGVGNASVRQADGRDGMAIHGPFDVIIAGGSFAERPERLVEQLSEGGRMLVPVGNAGKERWLLLTRKNDAISSQDIGPAAVLPLQPGVPELL